MTPAARLEEGLHALGLELSAPAQEKLLAYLALLRKWNRAYNLTAVDDPERMVSHHLLDSLAVVPVLERAASGVRRLADIGSGAGLPGIPLAVARPEWQLVLVEPNGKKAAFLRQATIELGLANAQVVEQRAERWHPEAGFEVVISRALADLSDFAAAAGHLCAPGGMLAAMKGVHPDDELAQLPVGVRVEDVAALEVPGLDARRHLVIMRVS
ncbi:MAG TPA: 16S rRNA (guanine(527)-N(7))-methyltransferase RsmG [Burkholderiales bacterium]|nr:16S rRNA (guanine(527)-N(7))-methyltransferase RsmG [Burkholderiales bacterium]